MLMFAGREKLFLSLYVNDGLNSRMKTFSVMKHYHHHCHQTNRGEVRSFMASIYIVYQLKKSKIIPIFEIIKKSYKYFWKVFCKHISFH
jgi:hypothetical protein